MECLEGLMLLKDKYGFDIVDIYQNKVLLVELEEELNRIINELIDRDCLILENSQREEIIKGRPIPKLIEKTNEYRMYEWTDTKEQFIVKLDDFIKRPIRYDMYLVFKSDTDIKTQIFNFRKNFPIFLSSLTLKDFLKNAREEKEIIFVRDLDADSALRILEKGRELKLQMKMKKS